MNIDFDIFFFYGQNNIDVENDFDVKIGINQPKRTMFYNRQEGCGIHGRENNPTSLALLTGLRYDIAKWFAKRNDTVQAINKNRILAVSQNTITIKSNYKKGEVDIEILYIPYVNLKPQKITF